MYSNDFSDWASVRLLPQLACANLREPQCLMKYVTLLLIIISARISFSCHMVDQENEQQEANKFFLSNCIVSCMWWNSCRIKPGNKDLMSNQYADLSNNHDAENRSSSCSFFKADAKSYSYAGIRAGINQVHRILLEQEFAVDTFNLSLTFDWFKWQIVLSSWYSQMNYWLSV